MQKLKLIKAFRRDTNTVHVMYMHVATLTDFVISWSNVDANGDITTYDIDMYCISSNEHFSDFILTTIDKGGDDLLYLELIETFNRTDCDDLS